MTEVQRANFVFDRIHSKALFDSLNEALNHFRPYFLISKYNFTQMVNPTLGTIPKKPWHFIS
jgi:hypothetical protein